MIGQRSSGTIYIETTFLGTRTFAVAVVQSGGVRS
jgi:hypothetical protein